MSYVKNADAFRIQRTMLKIIGMWPKKNPTTLNKIHTLFAFCWLTALAISLFCAVLFLEDFSQLIQSWAMFVSIFNCSLKFGIFYFKIPKFLKLMDFLSSTHFTYYDVDLDVHIKHSISITNIMVKIFITSAVFTVVSFSLAPLPNPKPRQLPLPFAADLTDASLPLYLFVYFFESTSLALAGWMSTSFDNVATSIMGLISAYFKILRSMIVRIADCKELISKRGGSQKEIIQFYGDFDKVINEKLSRCVDHHLAVIRLAEFIESIFTYVVLLQFLASAAGMCLAGVTFVNSPVGSYEFLFALSLLITLMIQISLYCTYGNEVTFQSAKVVDACYMTDWIYCGPLVRKTLFLIMERSKRPLILTAGKLINLSLSSLVGVFRSAVSYAAVLRQLDKKNS